MIAASIVQCSIILLTIVPSHDCIAGTSMGRGMYATCGLFVKDECTRSLEKLYHVNSRLIMPPLPSSARFCYNS